MADGDGIAGDPVEGSLVWPVASEPAHADNKVPSATTHAARVVVSRAVMSARLAARAER
jgi:hypothetical protein